MTILHPEDARRLSLRDKYGTLHTETRWASLADKIAGGSLAPRVQAKWAEVLSAPSSWTVQGAFDPWEIPENYGAGEDVGEMMEKIRADVQMCAKYAFRYKILGDSADAARAAAIIQAYANISTFATNGGSTLRWYESWGLLVQAAMIIRDDDAYTPALDSTFKATLVRAMSTFERIAYTRPNNWAAWGLVMEIAVGGFTEDRDRFTKGLRQWGRLFDETVVSGFRVTNGGPAHGQLRDNVAKEEIYRQGSSHGNGSYGLLYTAFHLNGLTIAAEYARLNGEWLFDHVSPDGSSFRGFWEEVAFLKRHSGPTLDADFLKAQWFNTSNKSTPGSSYYFSGYYTNRVEASFYILNALWPNEDAEQLLYGGFYTRDVPMGVYPTFPNGATAGTSAGYPIQQDYYGMWGADLLYSGRPLYG